MSIPTPADVMRRRPAGAPGGTGGQFQEKLNDPPRGALSDTHDDDLPIPHLVDDIPEFVTVEDERLRGEYRDLWKRLNAKHRSSTYGEAGRLSVVSTDPAELAVLAQLQAPGIAVNVANNPATPPAVLHMLAVGEADFRDPEARRAAVRHPNCAEATLRVVWAYRRSLDYQGTAKAEVTGAPNTPYDILDEAAFEGDPIAAARIADSMP